MSLDPFYSKCKRGKREESKAGGPGEDEEVGYGGEEEESRGEEEEGGEGGVLGGPEARLLGPVAEAEGGGVELGFPLRPQRPGLDELGEVAVDAALCTAPAACPGLRLGRTMALLKRKPMRLLRAAVKGGRTLRIFWKLR